MSSPRTKKTDEAASPLANLPLAKHRHSVWKSELAQKRSGSGGSSHNLFLCEATTVAAKTASMRRKAARALPTCRGLRVLPDCNLTLGAHLDWSQVKQASASSRSRSAMGGGLRSFGVSQGGLSKLPTFTPLFATSSASSGIGLGSAAIGFGRLAGRGGGK